MSKPDPEFTPEAMVSWALDMAHESALKMTQQERVALIRVVVKALVEAGIIDDPGECKEQSFELAVNALYICGLMPMVFPAAYKAAEVQVEEMQGQRLDNIEHLKRSFEL